MCVQSFIRKLDFKVHTTLNRENTDDNMEIFPIKI